MSIICTVIDCLAALIFLIFCGKNEWARAGVFFFQLLVVSIYFYLDVFLFLTGAKWVLRLPVEWRKSFPKALVGFGVEFKALCTLV